MTIEWNLLDVLGRARLKEGLVLGAIDGTKTTASHFTFVVGATTVVFDGSFTGNPNAPTGTFNAFHVYDDGVLVMDGSGYNLSVAGLLAAISQQNGDLDSEAIRVFLSNGPMRIAGSPGDDSPISGSPFADKIDGGRGGDLLFGNGGSDTIHGGRGNDFITGGSGNDRISGGKGADGIDGNQGNDVVSGGAGNDTFYFTEMSGVDRITDFVHGHDRISFGIEFFTGFTHTGTLSAAEFRVGAKALDADDRVIYNAKTGALYYDADGKGGAAQIKVAVLDAHLNLTRTDFQVEHLLA